MTHSKDSSYISKEEIDNFRRNEISKLIKQLDKSYGHYRKSLIKLINSYQRDLIK